MALNNIRKNGKFYLPFLLTCIATVTMFYIMCAITFNKGIDSMAGAETVKGFLYLGCYVIAIFAVIFLFYTNSFLIKRRKKEFGLYNILGMEKQHIACILTFETLFIAVTGIVGGIVTGIVLNKFIILILMKVVGDFVPIPFSVEGVAVQWTCILFGIVFLLILLSNVHRISRTDPIELLRGGNVGERDPKVKWPLVLVGILSMGGGYVLAALVQDPVEAMLLFFVAVVLVIIGTYCLFTAVSIAVLKLLRKKKNFYYRTGPFTAISGMIYRMKQNAVGLANICILSTMVLVMVSTTVCMYIGSQDTLDMQAPKDIEVRQALTTENGSFVENRENEIQKAEKTILKDVKDKGFKAKEIWQYRTFIVDTMPDEKGNLQYRSYTSYGDDAAYYLQFYRLSDYNQMTKQELELNKDEALFYAAGGTWKQDDIGISQENFHIAQRLKEYPIKSDYDMNQHSFYLVLEDRVFEELYLSYTNEMEAQGSSGYSSVYCIENFDLNGSEEEKFEFYQWINENRALNTEADIRIWSRQEAKQTLDALYGGFMFLGLFLGSLFVMAAVLIIYYKQISEGYDDKERFQIMQKVGMSKREVRRTIKVQILMVFFLPILVATMHMVAAFPMVRRMLAVIYLNNVGLYTICTIVTVLVFALTYAVVYALTARSYYRIVEG